MQGAGTALIYINALLSALGNRALKPSHAGGVCTPRQALPTELFRPVALGSGLYVAGDHRTTATLDGALKSGRLAAEAVLADLRK